MKLFHDQQLFAVPPRCLLVERSRIFAIQPLSAHGFPRYQDRLPFHPRTVELYMIFAVIGSINSLSTTNNDSRSLVENLWDPSVDLHNGVAPKSGGRSKFSCSTVLLSSFSGNISTLDIFSCSPTN
ncbi:hypothetical protein Nepgr_029693 [Nepenthes gracilis]|uniref:Uncharacterized protein n=1 Tax=Nepenthes gracilis TaxID=150966 RepID=A0AAD3TE20_NEPGR|nr:hypothetical protein Nepgr_029693 [Nepenthes gracilis]